MFISKSIEIALTEVLKRIVYTFRRPMWESNSTSVYEPFAKYEHCRHEKKEFCDRSLHHFLVVLCNCRHSDAMSVSFKL